MSIRPLILDFGQATIAGDFFGRRKTYFFHAANSGEAEVLASLRDFRIKCQPKQFHDTGSISTQSIVIVYRPEAHFSNGQEFQETFLDAVDLGSARMILLTQDSSYAGLAQHQQIYLLNNLQQVNELCRLHNQLKAGLYN